MAGALRETLVASICGAANRQSANPPSNHGAANPEIPYSQANHGASTPRFQVRDPQSNLAFDLFSGRFAVAFGVAADAARWPNRWDAIAMRVSRPDRMALSRLRPDARVGFGGARASGRVADLASAGAISVRVRAALRDLVGVDRAPAPAVSGAAEIAKLCHRRGRGAVAFVLGRAFGGRVPIAWGLNSVAESPWVKL